MIFRVVFVKQKPSCSRISQDMSGGVGQVMSNDFSKALTSEPANQITRLI